MSSKAFRLNWIGNEFDSRADGFNYHWFILIETGKLTSQHSCHRSLWSPVVGSLYSASACHQWVHSHTGHTEITNNR